jgi:hypothetical protein
VRWAGSGGRGHGGRDRGKHTLRDEVSDQVGLRRGDDHAKGVHAGPANCSDVGKDNIADDTRNDYPAAGASKELDPN